MNYLGVASLALDTFTQLVGRAASEGISFWAGGLRWLYHGFLDYLQEDGK